MSLVEGLGNADAGGPVETPNILTEPNIAPGFMMLTQAVWTRSPATQARYFPPVGLAIRGILNRKYNPP